MNGENKFLVIMVSLALISVSVVLTLALIMMWEEREKIITAGCVLMLVFFMASIVVWTAKQINEQQLRRKRVLYHQELPLDQDGAPYYIPGTMQKAPTHRQREPKQEPLSMYQDQTKY